MKSRMTFKQFWTKYKHQPLDARAKFFDSLSKKEQKLLINNFFCEGWHEVVVQNIIDQRLDFIKQKYGIDLIDIRIKALKFDRDFFIPNSVWEHIEQLLLEFDEYYDSSVIFGGLSVSSCNLISRVYSMEVIHQNVKKTNEQDSL